MASKVKRKKKTAKTKTAKTKSSAGTTVKTTKKKRRKKSTVKQDDVTRSVVPQQSFETAIIQMSSMRASCYNLLEFLDKLNKTAEPKSASVLTTTRGSVDDIMQSLQKSVDRMCVGAKELHPNIKFPTTAKQSD